MKDLYTFTDDHASFRVDEPNDWSGLYFPLVNERGLLSAITPDLQGDIKVDQHTFLNLPVSIEDLHSSRVSRNFWISLAGVHWSVTGRSVWQRARVWGDEPSTLHAGFLWHEVSRSNKKLGLEATVRNFIPAIGAAVEVMEVRIKNISKKPISLDATSAIPLYARSADNLRDHRHVSSLLHRVQKEKNGISICPTMSFNERGHLINSTVYYVLGIDDSGRPPVGFYPTVASFIGEGGDFEQPAALVKKAAPKKDVTATDQGKEAVGALRFKTVRLAPGKTATFTLLMGIDKEARDRGALVERFRSPLQVQHELEATKKFWLAKLAQIKFQTGDVKFNRWIKWVSAQPTFRKIFGCSFLPDFDYGKGGRGWRDLWQDCLALLLQNPGDVRDDIVHNYGGIRIDGSNATIIARKEIPNPADPHGAPKWRPEFIADRNNITRTWMDHGLWPFLTTQLYLHQTGDWNILLETVPYFRDPLTHRAKHVDAGWATAEKEFSGEPEGTCKLRTVDRKIYYGTLLEHILVQTLVQFFNVGDHNNIRLEDADWNDGLDMAHKKGESVAFTSMYAGNLKDIASVLEIAKSKFGWTSVEVAGELQMLMDRLSASLNYDSAVAKRERLQEYFNAVAGGVKGTRAKIAIDDVIRDVNAKAEWIKNHINKNEWIELSKERLAWFNGYYDNRGERVEGRQADGSVRMTLTGQVYPIMTGVADASRVKSIVNAVNQILFDKKLGGVRLNSDFGSIQPNLGRAFSFAYGEKENGAVFSHMAVMYANALYQRGFAADGYAVFNSLFKMAASSRSAIYPGLPEYFNNEGRGRYAYLTGSASWMILTLLTQVFGVRGHAGDLLLAPKLMPAQYDRKKEVSVELSFAGARVKVLYRNPSLVPYEKMKIHSVMIGGREIFTERISDKEVLIPRSELTASSVVELIVELRSAS